MAEPAPVQEPKPAPEPTPALEPTPVPEPTKEDDGDMDDLMELFAALSLQEPTYEAGATDVPCEEDSSAVDEPVEEPTATHNNDDDSMDELLESFAKLSIQEPTYEAGTTDIPVETAPVETAPVETAPAETAPAETAPVETAPVETAPSNPFTDITLTVIPAAAFTDFKPTVTPAVAFTSVEEIPAYVETPVVETAFEETASAETALNDEIAPIIKDDYDYYNDPLAEEAFADMTFAEDEENNTIEKGMIDHRFFDDENDVATVKIANTVDPIFEIPIPALFQPRRRRNCSDCSERTAITIWNLHRKLR